MQISLVKVIECVASNKGGENQAIVDLLLNDVGIILKGVTLTFDPDDGNFARSVTKSTNHLSDAASRACVRESEPSLNLSGNSGRAAAVVGYCSENRPRPIRARLTFHAVGQLSQSQQTCLR